MLRSSKMKIVAFCLAVALLGASTPLLSWGFALNKSPSPYSPKATVRVVGHGKAHGVGLCMAGVLGRVRAGQTYKQIIPKYLLGTKVQAMKLPSTIRVGLNSYPTSSDISVVADRGCGRFLIRDSQGILYEGTADDTTWVRYIPSEKRYQIVIDNSTQSYTFSTTSSFVRFVPQRIPATSAATVFRVKNLARRYRGSIEVRYSTNSRRTFVINVINLEQYLRGIAEEPDEWPMEGLRLMAVACRSYASARYFKPKHSADGFHICASPHCQYYTGFNREQYQPRVSSAVSQTRGQVVTYQGKLIVVPFFSTCGGKTENIENVWLGASPKPYLRGVTCGYCNFAKSYRWDLSMTLSQLEKSMNSSSTSRVPGRLVSFTVLKRGFSPRVVRMRINGTNGKKTLTGTDFQEALGWKSSWFWIVMPSRITSISWSTDPLTPGGDVSGDISTLTWKITAPSTVAVSIYSNDGRVVRSYGPWKQQQAGEMNLTWDGRDQSGNVVGGGTYIFVISVRNRYNCYNEFRGTVAVQNPKYTVFGR